MMDCIVNQFGCSCETICRLPRQRPAPRRASLFAQLITSIIFGIIIASAAYVGLSRAEAVYQQEARV